MSDLRDLAKSLNTERIMNFPLHETIQQECEGISRSGIICASVAVEGASRDIEGQKKLIVFRVVQEAIQNCIKHAHAATISISLLYDISGIRIMVIDDGKGFNVTRALESSHGSGIGNIRRRAALAKATCTIESTIGQGTTVRIFVPYG